jgi:hypothetical protein
MLPIVTDRTIWFLTRSNGIDGGTPGGEATAALRYKPKYASPESCSETAHSGVMPYAIVVAAARLAGTEVDQMAPRPDTDNPPLKYPLLPDQLVTISL